MSRRRPIRLSMAAALLAVTMGLTASAADVVVITGSRALPLGPRAAPGPGPCSELIENSALYRAVLRDNPTLATFEPGMREGAYTIAGARAVEASVAPYFRLVYEDLRTRMNAESGERRWDSADEVWRDAKDEYDTWIGESYDSWSRRVGATNLISPADHPVRAAAPILAARAAAILGDPVAARAYAGDALSRLDAAGGRDQLLRATAHLVLADVARASGESAQAAAAADQALRALRTRPDLDRATAGAELQASLVLREEARAESDLTGAALFTPARLDAEQARRVQIARDRLMRLDGLTGLASHAVPGYGALWLAHYDPDAAHPDGPGLGAFARDTLLVTAALAAPEAAPLAPAAEGSTRAERLAWMRECASVTSRAGLAGDLETVRRAAHVALAQIDRRMLIETLREATKQARAGRGDGDTIHDLLYVFSGDLQSIGEAGRARGAAGLYLPAAWLSTLVATGDTDDVARALDELINPDTLRAVGRFLAAVRTEDAKDQLTPEEIRVLGGALLHGKNAIVAHLRAPDRRTIADARAAQAFLAKKETKPAFRALLARFRDDEGPRDAAPGAFTSMRSDVVYLGLQTIADGWLERAALARDDPRLAARAAADAGERLAKLTTSVATSAPHSLDDDVRTLRTRSPQDPAFEAAARGIVGEAARAAYDVYAADRGEAWTQTLSKANVAPDAARLRADDAAQFALDVVVGARADAAPRRYADLAHDGALLAVAAYGSEERAGAAAMEQVRRLTRSSKIVEQIIQLFGGEAGPFVSLLRPNDAAAVRAVTQAESVLEAIDARRAAPALSIAEALVKTVSDNYDGGRSYDYANLTPDFWGAIARRLLASGRIDAAQAAATIWTENALADGRQDELVLRGDALAQTLAWRRDGDVFSFTARLKAQVIARAPERASESDVDVLLAAVERANRTVAGDAIAEQIRAADAPESVRAALAEWRAASLAVERVEAASRDRARQALRLSEFGPLSLDLGGDAMAGEAARRESQAWATLVEAAKAARTDLRLAPPALRDLRAALRPGEVLISGARLPDQLVLIGVTKDGAPDVVVRPLPGGDFDAAIAAYTKGLRFDESGAPHDFPIDAALTLFDNLVAPMKGAATARRIVWSPPRDVGQIPAAAFAREADGEIRFLGLEKEMMTAPTLTSFTAQRLAGEPAPTRRLLAVGDIAFRGGAGSGLLSASTQDVSTSPTRDLLAQLSPTRAARDVLTYVQGLGPDAAVLAGARASRAALDGERGRSFDVVLFHTHGVDRTLTRGCGDAAQALVLYQPSGGACASALLSADEITALRLKARLVILAACSTGAAPDAGLDAMSGLTRAFLAGGARAVLTARLPVDDSSAAIVSRRLLEASRTGVAPTAALRAAMQELSAPDGRGHPAFWAQFELVGEGARTP